MKTVPLTARHARSVAALHIQGINTGFISSLGLDFVTALYEAIAKSAYSFGFAVGGSSLEGCKWKNPNSKGKGSNNENQ